MKNILNSLYEHKTLSKETAKEVLVNISSAKYNPSQVASFLSVYLMRPITAEELSGFRDAMLELCLKTKFNTNETIDIVGTGGDGKDTFNISTLSCFVAAGAGIKVTKHGNYGVSSVSGSSNVLEAIGYKFTNDNSILQKQLDEAGLCFMHAPLFHPAMKNVAAIRKELGVRTFFNMLGPIVNPCFPKYQLIGVYNLEMVRLYNYLLQSTHNEYAIVHSFDGYDEISLTGNYKVIFSDTEKIIEPEIKLKQKDLSGGKTAEESAKIFLNVIKGEGTKAQNEVVIANAGMAINLARTTRGANHHKGMDLEACFAIARESLESGRAFDVYKKLIK